MSNESDQGGVLFGPYGTILEERAKEINVPDLTNPVKIIFDDGPYKDETARVAKGYLDAGATYATTNTFGLRNLIHSSAFGALELYTTAVFAHAEVVRDALRKRIFKKLLFCFGPFGDCYNPQAAPDSLDEGFEFHDEQIHVAQEFALENPEIPIGVVFETICTVREAISVAEIAQCSDLPIIASLVIDKDAKLFDDTPLSEALREIDDASNKSLWGFSVNCCPIEGVFNAIDRSNGKRDRLVMAYPNASSEDPRKLEEHDGIVHLSDHATTADDLVRIIRQNPTIRIIGGCCGFDHQAIEHLASAVKVDSL